MYAVCLCIRARILATIIALAIYIRHTSCKNVLINFLSYVLLIIITIACHQRSFVGVNILAWRDSDLHRRHMS